MKSGVSEIVGQAIFSDGTRADAYRALRSLFCASCGGVVAAQALFTRAAASARQGLQLWPRCRACVPFTLAPVKPQRSPLLESLLAPTEQEKTTASSKLDATEQEKADGRSKSAEEMRRRLGPALERSRRSRSGRR